MTHHERRERLRAAVDAVRGGKPIVDVAAENHLSFHYLYQACKLSGVIQDTKHEERRRVAEDFHAGMMLDEMSAKHGLGVARLRVILKESGIKKPRWTGPAKSTSTYAILADLLQTEKSQVEIAAQHLVSRQYISHILQRAKAAGIVFPTR